MDLHLGDCLEKLKELPDDSVDACVTDPPYGLSFMGKKWDYDVPSIEIWKEVLRVLKPGGHLLSFGGTRTYHRMAVAIEDAGFEIRDQIQWIYGSGFPKSHNLHKATGDDRWDGWGTALKPANEPICMARKPISEKTIAENVLKWGVGGINVDASRVGFANSADEKESKVKNQHGAFGSGPMTNNIFGEYSKDRTNYNPPGRFPANLLLDEAAATVLDAQSGISPSNARRKKKGDNSQGVIGWTGTDVSPPADSGGASRFFYVAKVSARERAGSTHPTMKPAKLMGYLCRLITPPNGVVLDPFMGSGSTGIAAKNLGFKFIGIEREQEYHSIATARMA